MGKWKRGEIVDYSFLIAVSEPDFPISNQQSAIFRRDASGLQSSGSCHQRGPGL
jgi:hypothetical protein